MSTGTLAYINYCPFSGMQELLKIEGSPPGTHNPLGSSAGGDSSNYTEN
jgi:hypothetical protein